MKKKIIAILLGSVGGLFLIGFIILIPILMILDFFGVNITDGYVENNSEYADEYRNVVNKYIKESRGYVPLTRILYFYTADNSLSFDVIYNDNLDSESKKMLPISEVCTLSRYKVLNVCQSDYISESGQLDEEQAKPFAPPIDFASSTITSFFKEERIVYGESDVHSAWDLANSAQAPVYAVCDGVIEAVNFPYLINTIDKNGPRGGNIIKINCKVNELTYTVLYGHLYPNSSQVSVGDIVEKGQVIASVGTTGYSTGNHLHYQVSLNNETVDGMSLVDFTYEIESTPSFNQPDLPFRPTY